MKALLIHMSSFYNTRKKLSEVFTKPVIASFVALYVVIVGVSLHVMNMNESNGVRAVVPVPLDTTKLKSENLVLNSKLEIEDENGSPVNWNKGDWGNNERKMTYGVDGFTGKGAKVEITAYTDGDAKWYFDDVLVTAGEQYTFKHAYLSTTETSLTVRYKLADGTYLYEGLADLKPATDWVENVITFVPPAEAVSLTMMHNLSGVGELTIDDQQLYLGNAFTFDKGKVTFSFDDGWIEHYEIAAPVLSEAGVNGTFYIMTGESLDDDLGTPYVNLKQTQAISDMGHEIGSHTKTHPYLSQLGTIRQIDQIKGSRQIFEREGFQIKTIAYPYGDFDTDVQEITAEAGYTFGRSVLRGYNDRATDPFALKIQQVDRMTSLEEMKGWIDKAEEDNTWLILMFHQIGDNMSEDLGVTESDFKALVKHAVEADVDVITVEEGATLFGLE